ncbi:MAG: DUF4339 domain-containing protein, partial [bacterium]|nr:DUF4339 domain-containing protein [bacterium]
MADESPKWYIILADERDGPYSTQDIQYLVARQRINGNTLIWQKEMRNWTPLCEVETFLPKPPPEPEETSEKKPASKDRRRFPFLKLGALLAGLGLA